MATGKQIIKKACSFEGRGGTKFWNDYGLPKGSAWCCAFVWDIFRLCKASKLFLDGGKTAYVPTAQEWLKKNCKHVKMDEAQAGDVVVFTWTGGGNNSERGSRDHIGFIRKGGTAKTCYTIEGNTSGGKVAKRTRNLTNIYGIYRPRYDKPKADYYTGDLPTGTISKRTGTVTNVKRWQKFLCWWGTDVSIDGVFGNDTEAKTKAFQKKYGLEVDGVAGEKTLAKAKVIAKSEKH